MPSSISSFPIVILGLDPGIRNAAVVQRRRGDPSRLTAPQALHRLPDAADPRVKPEDDDGVGECLVMEPRA
ncbi:hypothetical protein SAMN05428936_101729 [Pelagibacterium halotolerans]|nr:hypothetical protein SAMN05428936_101729 [Pelagibacterium halotolerans]